MSVKLVIDPVEKFRGCMLGGLLGDCIGRPFEGKIIRGAGHCIPSGKFSTTRDESKTGLKEFFTTMLSDSPETRFSRLLDYTDDTAMAFSVAMSLVEKGTYEPEDMAEKFVDEYFLRPGLGYSVHVFHVFYALKKNGCQDVFGPAKHQFGGSGSYGNGAAMRVAPVALFAYKDEDLIKHVAKSSSKITHAHHHGYNGAILQALAVHQALLADTSVDFDPVQFIDTLFEKMDKIEKKTSGHGSFILWPSRLWNLLHPRSLENERPYCKSLKRMKKIFEKKPVNITPEEVQEIFGHHVTAHKSVPTALFAFLRGFQPLEDFESDNPFVRTLYFAIAVGGDTDTIACMAGNIAGAYHGESVIPDSLIRKCEGTQEIKNLGDQLFQLNLRRRQTA